MSTPQDSSEHQDASGPDGTSGHVNDVDETGEAEIAVGNYVADVRGSDDVLYEIQTGSFSPLKKKLATLIENHKVVLVYPIAAVRYIVKLPTDPDAQATRRKSPKRGDLTHVVEELVSIPTLLNHANFELEVVLIEEDEFRLFDPDRVRRRNGWRVVGRELTEVLGRRRFRCRDDLFDLIKEPLPEVFTTRELAEAMGQPRSLAQKLAYCLRESGALEICGKSGNALCYQRAVANSR